MLETNAAGIIFKHDCVILDACCIINLYESGHMAEVLESIPKSVMVAAYVQEEEVLRYDLQPMIERGLLSITDVESVEEEISWINYAALIGDDGEAVTGAIAFHRDWAIATDDRKAITVFSVEAPNLQLVSTPDLIKHWVDVMNPMPEIVRSALEKIQMSGHFIPRRSHPLHQWWKAIMTGQST